MLIMFLVSMLFALFLDTFYQLKKFLSILVYECFIMNEYWILSNVLYIYWDDHRIFPLLPVNVLITLIEFLMIFLYFGDSLCFVVSVSLG